MDRVILHIDMNNFYASVECLYDPSLREVPMAVGGDREQRHGIVLAKNKGVKTAEPLWQAQRKCPDIVFVKPHPDRYHSYSEAARELYEQYTDQVESFGLDECWLDVTGSTRLFGSGERIAEEIRRRVRRELGLTVSVGVSFNKVFAKLGSDYRKPDAVTVFSRENYKDLVWPLPVRDLLFVGDSTERLLKRYGMDTIGSVARSPCQTLRKLLGKSGEALWLSARGEDLAPVRSITEEPEPKSIGSSTTTSRDLTTEQEVKPILCALSESVAERLRGEGLSASCIHLSIRRGDLRSYGHQCTVAFPVSDSQTIYQTALRLFREAWDKAPIRTLGVRATQLSSGESVQCCLFPEAGISRRRAALESAMDQLRVRFGRDALARGVFYERDSSRGMAGEKRDPHPANR